MKKIILSSVLAVTFCFAFTPKSQAQVKNNVVRLNVWSIAVSTVSLFYERALNEKMSAQLQGFYTSVKAGDLKYSGWGVTPEFRYYPGQEAPSGFYIGPFLRYTSFTLSEQVFNEEWKTNYTTYGGGVLLGYQWLFGDVVALDIFFGPKYSVGNVKVEAGEELEGRSGFGGGFWFRSGLAVGVAF